MFPSFRSFTPYLRLLGLMVVAGFVLVGCGPGAHQPAVAISAYDRAKEAFQKGQLDEALERTYKLAAKTPPAESTERARVLRAVIYAGELKGSYELAEAYSKGAERSKNPHFQANYRRLRSDNLAAAANAALGLAETAHQIAPDGTIAKELILEATFPSTEGPTDIKQLAKVEEGGWIEPEEQDGAATDALRKGVDDALADVVSGDRSKARQALASGSVKLEGAAFALFLAKELAEGAVVFNRHHARDSIKLKTLCEEGGVCLKAALALLKDAPDKDMEKEVKKLQDKFKTIQKDT